MVLSTKNQLSNTPARCPCRLSMARRPTAEWCRIPACAHPVSRAAAGRARRRGSRPPAGAAVEDERSSDGDQYPVTFLQGFTGGLAPAKVSGEPLIPPLLDTAIQEIGVRAAAPAAFGDLYVNDPPVQATGMHVLGEVHSQPGAFLVGAQDLRSLLEGVVGTVLPVDPGDRGEPVTAERPAYPEVDRVLRDPAGPSCTSSMRASSRHGSWSHSQHVSPQPSLSGWASVTRTR